MYKPNLPGAVAQALPLTRTAEEQVITPRSYADAGGSPTKLVTTPIQARCAPQRVVGAIRFSIRL